MNIARYLLLFIISFVCSTTFASSVIRVDTKKLGDETVFVFYHDRFVNINANFHTNLGNVTASRPIQLAFVNEPVTKALTKSFSINAEKTGFSFTTKAKYQVTGKINGERVTAIKLKDIADINKKTNEPIADAPKAEEKIQIANVEPVVEEPSKARNTESTRAPVNAIVKKNKDGITLSFPFKTNPRAAVFKRGKYVWVVFESYVDFAIPQNEFIEEYTQVRNTSSVLRLTVSKLPYISTNFTNGYWNITFTSASINSTLIAPVQLSTDPDYSVAYKNVFGNTKMISLEDPDIGDEIKVVLGNKTGAFITKESVAIDFQVLQSLQGLAVVAISDDLTIDIAKNTVSISSHYEAPDESYITIALPPSETRHDGKITSMLPTITSDILVKNFVPIREHMWQAIAQSTVWRNGDANYNKKLDLAQLYFMHGMYYEAHAMLNIARTGHPKAFAHDKAMMFQQAVTLTLLGKYHEAKELYHQLNTLYSAVLPEEVMLLKNYNEYMIGNAPPFSIGLIGALNKFVNIYPDDLYWPLAFAEIELCLQNNNSRTLELLFKSLRAPRKNVDVNTLKYYKAHYYRKKDQSNLAKQLFTELATSKGDPYNSTRAQLELTKIMFDLYEIDAGDAASRLDNVRFNWRGDKVEFDLLLALAEFYKGDKNLVQSLRTYKYVHKAFTGQFQSFYIASEMAKIYNSIFLPGGTAEKMNDFDVVSLFYEFKDSTPIGVDGDNVILMIAKRLINLDLLDSAIVLLKHQVDYRLSGEKRLINADHLALVLIMDNKPQEAINVLNSTDKGAVTFKEYIYRQQLKAKAMIDLGRYNEALSYIPHDDDAISSTMKKEAYFKSGNWKEYVKYVKAEVDEALKNKIEGDVAQDTLRLAIAYSMLNDTANLVRLQSALKTDNEQLKASVDFLLATNQPIDHRNLDKSLNIDQMEHFMKDSKQRLFN